MSFCLHITPERAGASSWGGGEAEPEPGDPSVCRAAFAVHLWQVRHSGQDSPLPAEMQVPSEKGARLGG